MIIKVNNFHILLTSVLIMVKTILIIKRKLSELLIVHFEITDIIFEICTTNEENDF